MNIVNCKNSGFTLTELSIVIVIISLLIAGVFSGQLLVNNSKLQNVIREIREYDAAVKTFRDKFKYYPGDLPTATATAYWSGSSTPNAANIRGNWKIESGATTATSYEDLCFWQQLALSGLIPGTYTGTTGGTSVPLYTLGTNVPKSVLSLGGYQAFYATNYYGTTGNLIQLGGLSGNSGEQLNGYILKPADAYLIDTKIDDGLAASGNLYTTRAITYDAVATKCTSDSYTSSTATYLLNDNTVSCRIFWWLDKNK